MSSCSLGVIKNGGERPYTYNPNRDYSIDELKELSSQVIETTRRDPPVGKNETLFSNQMGPLKRFGIIVFESEIQPTRGGLSEQNKIYLKAQGKQLLTEMLLSSWDQSLTILAHDLDYLKIYKMKKSVKLHQHGSKVEDHVKTNRSSIAPDDIFYLPPGKETTTSTVLNSRGMRDLSLALVPAVELMAGPKFSEHAKHAVNEVAKELKLDAVIVVMSKIEWTSAHIDKHSGESIPEEASVRIIASSLIPLSEYHKRLSSLGIKRDQPNVTVAFRTYQGSLQIPLNISVPESQQSYETIEENLLSPILKSYNDLAHMVQIRMVDDLKKTL